MAASFPAAVKTFTTKVDDVTDILAEHINSPQEEIVAIETELGTDPAGAYATVKARFEAIEAALPVFLTTPLTSTSWDGDAFSTTAKTLIDLSAVFGLPAGVSAVLVRIVARDSGSDGSTTPYFGLAPDSGGGHAALVRPAGIANDTYAEQTAVVPCDGNGDIYYQIVATGAGTMDCHLQIWGYWP